MLEDATLNYEVEDFRFTMLKDNGLEIELIKDGANTKVTHENKKEYVDHVVNFYLYKDVNKEIKEFLKGFYQVIPHNLMAVFDADELDFIVCGTPDINLDDWKENTSYRGDFTEKHKVVKWFWTILGKLSQE